MAVPRHWSVESGLHWVLGGGSHEDTGQVRRRLEPGVPRKIALNLARANTTLKAGFKGKRKCAGRDDTFTWLH